MSMKAAIKKWLLSCKGPGRRKDGGWSSGSASSGQGPADQGNLGLH